MGSSRNISKGLRVQVFIILDECTLYFSPERGYKIRFPQIKGWKTIAWPWRKGNPDKLLSISNYDAFYIGTMKI
mgnify:CR=1 FL=1